MNTQVGQTISADQFNKMYPARTTGTERLISSGIPFDPIKEGGIPLTSQSQPSSSTPIADKLTSSGILVIILAIISIFLIIVAIRKKKLRFLVPFAMIWVESKNTGQKIISTAFFLVECGIIFLCFIFLPLLLSNWNILNLAIFWLSFYISILILNLIFFALKNVWD